MFCICSGVMPWLFKLSFFVANITIHKYRYVLICRGNFLRWGN